MIRDDLADAGASRFNHRRIRRNFDLLGNGADRDNRYGMGALLLDAGDPTKVLARTDRPLMVPETEYEHDGFLTDVVFPTGHVDLGDGDIRVYYGAADTSVCAVDLSIDDREFCVFVGPSDLAATAAFC